MAFDGTMRGYAEFCGASICYSAVRNLTYIEHLHSLYELLYVESGCVEAEAASQRITLSPGDLLFVADGTIHCYATAQYSRTILVAVDPREVPRFAALLNAHRAPFCCLRDTRENPAVSSSIAALTGTEPDDVNPIAAVGYISLLLSQLVPALETAGPWEEPRPTVLRSALKYIMDRIPKPVSADDVASAVGVSTFHLSRVFNKNIGINLSNYCALINTLTARRMLVQTSLPIDDIRQRCGYTNLRSFDRDFSRFSGITPRKYREKGQPEGIVDYDTPFVRDKLFGKWMLTGQDGPGAEP